MIALDRLKLLLGITNPKDDALLTTLLNDALDFILSYTGRAELPPGLLTTQVRIAAIYWNRRGMEGEKEQTDGAIRHAIDYLPDDIQRALNPWRLVKVVGMY